MRKLFILIIFLPFPSFASPVDNATFAHSMKIATSEGVPLSIAAQSLMEESGDKVTGSRGDFARDSRFPEDAQGYHSSGGFQFYMNPEKNLNWLLDKFWYGRGDTEKFDVYNYVHNTKLYARYMVYLHNRFGTWELAAARYNCGPNKKVIPASSLEYARRVVKARDPVIE